MDALTFTAARRQYTIRVCPHRDSWAIFVGATPYETSLQQDEAIAQAVRLAEKMKLAFVGIYDEHENLTSALAVNEHLPRPGDWSGRTTPVAE